VSHTDNTKEKEENSKTVYDTARDEKVSELDILRQSLEDRKKQADDYYDQLLRLKAEFENFRKRAEREKQNHLMWGKEDVLTKQLMLIDALEQADKSLKTSTNIESVKKGVELIHQEFVKMLQSEGVTEIECLGKQFDPHLEEALEQVASDKEEGTVVDVIQKGYCLNGKVIRYAKVKVSQQNVKDEQTEKEETKQ